MWGIWLVIGCALTRRIVAQVPVLPAEASGTAQLQVQQMSAEPRPSPAVRELDLLGKASFAQAEEATVTVRVYDRSGKLVGGLPDTAFRLMVNGTMRTATVEGHTEIGARQVPLVLLVFPPNQQEVHSLAVKQARQYFAGLGEELKWKVALLDADGTTTSYTQKREEVLAGLDTLGHKTEPLVYSNSNGGLGPFRWSGGWLDKAEYAVAQMRPYEGPKLLLAFNRSADEKMEEGRKPLSNAGPESLVYMAISAGAHIYIADVSGPGVLVPGGDASTGEIPEQVGPVPYDLQRRTQFAELQHFAYRAAVMQMTARDTLGGFANSVTELAGKMERDVEVNYSLRFALTAADRDNGVPHVEVQQVGEARNRLIVVDVSPLGTEVEQRAESQEKMAEMWRATAKPVASSEFRIAQRVDYFPVRGGMQPILPMSAEVAWLGTGPRPKTIHVAEFVQNIALDSPVLMKEVETELVGRALEWERDGKLAPGTYDWRVVVHDGKGHVLASAACSLCHRHL